MSHLESDDRAPIHKPKPEDFGLTNDLINKFYELELRNGRPSNAEGICVLTLFVLLGIGALSKDLVIQFFCLVVWGIFGFIFLRSKTIFKFRLKKIPNSYTKYKTANQNFISINHQLKKEIENRKTEELKIKENEQRKKFEYWTSIDPYKFESEIAILFERNGFISTATKGSGDGGVDIELKIGSKRGAVQCKRQKTKVSPGVVRDLYGTMVAGNYDFAFAVCPAGFSDQTFEFVKGKKIGLIGLKRITDMAREEGPLDFLRV